MSEDSYGWIITKDHIEEQESGTMGPSYTTLTKEQIVTKGEPFEMYDDDDNLYYEGYLLGGDGFEPLDDFGMPNAGCTYIKINGEHL